MTDLITEVARHIYDTYAEFADCDLPAWDDLASTFKEPSIAAAERVVPLIEAETRRKVAEELEPLLSAARVCLKDGCDCDYVLGADECTGTLDCWKPLAWSLNP